MTFTSPPSPEKHGNEYSLLLSSDGDLERHAELSCIDLTDALLRRKHERSDLSGGWIPGEGIHLHVGAFRADRPSLDRARRWIRRGTGYDHPRRRERLVFEGSTPRHV